MELKSMSSLIAKSLADIDYPSSDGEPLGEFEIHFRVVSSLFEMLDYWFSKKPMVHVASNLMLYYEEGNPYKFVSPDVQVTIDIPKLPPRRTFLAWKEGKGPDFIVEVSSKSTWGNDLHGKMEVYRDSLKVQEYFLFDPLGENLIVPFVGYTLTNGEYELIKPLNGRLPSKVLGLHLERGEGYLRLFDPTSGKYLTSADDVRKANENAEAEVRRLEAEVHQHAAREEQLRREIESLRQQLPKKP
jgi:Uma2 family endonuclease